MQLENQSSPVYESPSNPDLGFSVYRVDRIGLDEHYVFVYYGPKQDDFNYCYLGRGLLEQLAKTGNETDLRQYLQNINHAFLNALDQRSINIEELGWNLALAYAKDITRQRDLAELRPSF
jgi:hypothetical protein